MNISHRLWIYHHTSRINLLKKRVDSIAIPDDIHTAGYCLLELENGQYGVVHTEIELKNMKTVSP